MSNEERELWHYDQNVGGSTVKDKNMKQLKKDLRDAGVDIPIGKWRIADLRALALQHGIQMTIEKQKILPGWEGKPKGILQILWECGLIAESNYKTMTLNGRKNPLTGQIDKSMSLQCLLGKCADFQKELSALQALGVDLGVIVDATPKYHAEVASKGIEYSWGHAKGKYHWTALAQKQGQSNFIQLVKECCNPVEEITIGLVRLFARGECAYICTYYHLAQIQSGAQTEQDMQQNKTIMQQQKLF